jgi:hypothetical protein
MKNKSKAAPYARTPSRTVRCQICSWTDMRCYGGGILAKPCPECGCRVTFTQHSPGEPPVTPDLSLVSKPEPIPSHDVAQQYTDPIPVP